VIYVLLNIKVKLERNSVQIMQLKDNSLVLYRIKNIIDIWLETETSLGMGEKKLRFLVCMHD
jgi:hypothetical protein